MMTPEERVIAQIIADAIMNITAEHANNAVIELRKHGYVITKNWSDWEKEWGNLGRGK